MAQVENNNVDGLAQSTDYLRDDNTNDHDYRLSDDIDIVSGGGGGGGGAGGGGGSSSTSTKPVDVYLVAAYSIGGANASVIKVGTQYFSMNPARNVVLTDDGTLRILNTNSSGLMQMEKYNGNAQYVYYKIATLDVSRAAENYDINSVGIAGYNYTIGPGLQETYIYNILDSNNESTKFVDGTPYGFVLNYQDNVNNVKLQSVDIYYTLSAPSIYSQNPQVLLVQASTISTSIFTFHVFQGVVESGDDEIIKIRGEKVNIGSDGKGIYKLPYTINHAVTIVISSKKISTLYYIDGSSQIFLIKDGLNTATSPYFRVSNAEPSGGMNNYILMGKTNNVSQPFHFYLYTEDYIEKTDPNLGDKTAKNADEVSYDDEFVVICPPGATYEFMPNIAPIKYLGQITASQTNNFIPVCTFTLEEGYIQIDTINAFYGQYKLESKQESDIQYKVVEYHEGDETTDENSGMLPGQKRVFVNFIKPIDLLSDRIYIHVSNVLKDSTDYSTHIRFDDATRVYQDYETVYAINVNVPEIKEGDEIVYVEAAQNADKTRHYTNVSKIETETGTKYFGVRASKILKGVYIKEDELTQDGELNYYSAKDVETIDDNGVVNVPEGYRLAYYQKLNIDDFFEDTTILFPNSNGEEEIRIKYNDVYGINGLSYNVPAQIVTIYPNNIQKRIYEFTNGYQYVQLDNKSNEIYFNVEPNFDIGGISYSEYLYQYADDASQPRELLPSFQFSYEYIIGNIIPNDKINDYNLKFTYLEEHHDLEKVQKDEIEFTEGYKYYEISYFTETNYSTEIHVPLTFNASGELIKPNLRSSWPDGNGTNYQVLEYKYDVVSGNSTDFNRDVYTRKEEYIKIPSNYIKLDKFKDLVYYSKFKNTDKTEGQHKLYKYNAQTKSYFEYTYDEVKDLEQIPLNIYSKSFAYYKVNSNNGYSTGSSGSTTLYGRSGNLQLIGGNNADLSEFIKTKQMIYINVNGDTFRYVLGFPRDGSVQYYTTTLAKQENKRLIGSTAPTSKYFIKTKYSLAGRKSGNKYELTRKEFDDYANKGYTFYVSPYDPAWKFKISNIAEEETILDLDLTGNTIYLDADHKVISRQLIKKIVTEGNEDSIWYNDVESAAEILSGIHDTTTLGNGVDKYKLKYLDGVETGIYFTIDFNAPYRVLTREEAYERFRGSEDTVLYDIYVDSPGYIQLPDIGEIGKLAEYNIEIYSNGDSYRALTLDELNNNAFLSELLKPENGGIKIHSPNDINGKMNIDNSYFYNIVSIETGQISGAQYYVGNYDCAVSFDLFSNVNKEYFIKTSSKYTQGFERGNYNEISKFYASGTDAITISTLSESPLRKVGDRYYDMSSIQYYCDTVSHYTLKTTGGNSPKLPYPTIEQLIDGLDTRHTPKGALLFETKYFYNSYTINDGIHIAADGTYYTNMSVFDGKQGVLSKNIALTPYIYTDTEYTYDYIVKSPYKIRENDDLTGVSENRYKDYYVQYSYETNDPQNPNGIATTHLSEYTNGPAWWQSYIYSPYTDSSSYVLYTDYEIKKSSPYDGYKYKNDGVWQYYDIEYKKPKTLKYSNNLLGLVFTENPYTVNTVQTWIKAEKTLEVALKTREFAPINNGTSINEGGENSGGNSGENSGQAPGGGGEITPINPGGEGGNSINPAPGKSSIKKAAAKAAAMSSEFREIEVETRELVEDLDYNMINIGGGGGGGYSGGGGGGGSSSGGTSSGSNVSPANSEKTGVALDTLIVGALEKQKENLKYNESDKVTISEINSALDIYENTLEPVITAVNIPFSLYEFEFEIVELKQIIYSKRNDYKQKIFQKRNVLHKDISLEKAFVLENAKDLVFNGSYSWNEASFDHILNYNIEEESYSWAEIISREGYWSKNYDENIIPLQISAYNFYDKDTVSNITATYNFIPNSYIISSVIEHPEISYNYLTNTLYEYNKFSYLFNGVEKDYPLSSPVIDNGNGTYTGLINVNIYTYEGPTKGYKVNLIRRTGLDIDTKVSNIIHQKHHISYEYFTYTQATPLTNEKIPILYDKELVPARSHKIQYWDNSSNSYIVESVIDSYAYYSYKYMYETVPFKVASYIYTDDLRISNFGDLGAYILQIGYNIGTYISAEAKELAYFTNVYKTQTNSGLKQDKELSQTLNNNYLKQTNSLIEHISSFNTQSSIRLSELNNNMVQQLSNFSYSNSSSIDSLNGRVSYAIDYARMATSNSIDKNTYNVSKSINDFKDTLHEDIIGGGGNELTTSYTIETFRENLNGTTDLLNTVKGETKIDGNNIATLFSTAMNSQSEVVKYVHYDDGTYDKITYTGTLGIGDVLSNLQITNKIPNYQEFMVDLVPKLFAAVDYEFESDVKFNKKGEVVSKSKKVPVNIAKLCIYRAEVLWKEMKKKNLVK